MKSQIQDYISYDIPTWHYVVFILCSIVIVWVFIHLIYRMIKRDTSIKYYLNMLALICWVIYPAVIYYVEITQMKIYPARVKYIVMDFSHSKLKESDTIDIYNSFVKDKRANCSDKKCTIHVTEFKHDREQTAAQFSTESKDMFYCANCPSPIDFDWSKKEFYAHVFFFPAERTVNSPLFEFFIS